MKFDDAIFSIAVSQDSLKPYFAVGFSGERVNLW